MTLEHYLKHRRRYEALVLFVILLLIATVNATTIILESIQEGGEVDWIRPWATELTAVFAIPVVLPVLFYFLNQLNLSWENLRWRALWLIPLFLLFAFLHIGVFISVRIFLWNLVGEEYVINSVLLGLLYEIRKELLTFLAILAIYYSYSFILTRLQGEAKFLSQSDNEGKQEIYRSQFLVKMLGRDYLVRVDQIQWVQSASNYVLLNCGDRNYPMRQTLKGIASELDPRQFIRVHRTAIVNLEKVSALKEKGDIQLELRTGETVPVSKTYLPELREALNQVQFSVTGSEIS